MVASAVVAAVVDSASSRGFPSAYEFRSPTRSLPSPIELDGVAYNDHQADDEGDDIIDDDDEGNLRPKSGNDDDDEGFNGPGRTDVRARTNVGFLFVVVVVVLATRRIPTTVIILISFFINIIVMVIIFVNVIIINVVNPIDDDTRAGDFVLYCAISSAVLGTEQCNTELVP
jgi:hypothetical protein